MGPFEEHHTQAAILRTDSNKHCHGMDGRRCSAHWPVRKSLSPKTQRQNWVECTAERLLFGALPIDGNWPRWYGQRPLSGLACRMKIAMALQDRTASMCQSGVAKPPL